MIAGLFVYLRTKKMGERFIVETNTVYGDGAYCDVDYKTSELRMANDYYGSEYKFGSEVSDMNYKYNQQKV